MYLMLIIIDKQIVMTHDTNLFLNVSEIRK